MMIVRLVDQLPTGFPELTEQNYRKLMLVSVSGIFLILLVLLAALAIAASNYSPWEEKSCGSR